MKSLLIVVALFGVAHADKFPASGPCDDAVACEKACKAGKKGSCYWGGVLIIQAGAKDEDEGRALALFDKACTKGEPDGCWQSANLVWYKESREKGDGSKARGAFQKACNKGHARACMRLGEIAAASEDEKSQKLAATVRVKGLKLLEAKCKAKMARACSWAAQLYDNGMLGIKQDPVKAQAFRDKRCVIDTGKACPPPAPVDPNALGQPSPGQPAPMKPERAGQTKPMTKPAVKRDPAATKVESVPTTPVPAPTKQTPTDTAAPR